MYSRNTATSALRHSNIGHVCWSYRFTTTPNHGQNRHWSFFAKSSAKPSTPGNPPARNASTSNEVNKPDTGANAKQQAPKSTPQPKKTMAQLDEELRLAMEGRAGDGGESGLELEDGKPVSMKRGVRENMFRYI